MELGDPTAQSGRGAALTLSAVEGHPLSGPVLGCAMQSQQASPALRYNRPPAGACLNGSRFGFLMVLTSASKASL